jgi:hypothetical protein
VQRDTRAILDAGLQGVRHMRVIDMGAMFNVRCSAAAVGDRTDGQAACS